jgi:hypothetical protein
VPVDGVDGTCFSVQAGLFDGEAREACLMGHCHSLALALSRRFGWGMVGLSDEEGLVHVATCLPDGRLLDADGYYAGRGQICISHGVELASSVSEEEVLALSAGGDWREPLPDLASTWIDDFLSQAGPAPLDC